jgi:hypothetical protein
MFKGIQRGLEKFFTKERVLVIIVFLIFAWVLFSYSNTKSYVYDGMASGAPPSNMMMTPPPPSNNSVSNTNNQPPANAGYAMQPVANPADLLPNDQNSQWSALNPNTVNSGSVLMPDLLQAGYHIGLDTIGQTLRNANLQLRSDPIIPKKDAFNGIFQSTIEPNLGQVPLELGYGSP